jgi:hypothetical protein
MPFQEAPYHLLASSTSSYKLRQRPTLATLVNSSCLWCAYASRITRPAYSHSHSRSFNFILDHPPNVKRHGSQSKRMYLKAAKSLPLIDVLVAHLPIQPETVVGFKILDFPKSAQKKQGKFESIFLTAAFQRVEAYCSRVM